jgi:hypothetical protein
MGDEVRKRVVRKTVTQKRIHNQTGQDRTEEERPTRKERMGQRRNKQLRKGKDSSLPIWATHVRQGRVRRGPVCCCPAVMTQRVRGLRCTWNSLTQAEGMENIEEWRNKYNREWMRRGY